MIEIRWHGRGGQGAFTAAKLLGAAIVCGEKKYALSFPSFGPERRGAPIQAFTKIDDVPVINRTEIKKCDFLVFLDDTLFTKEAMSDLKAGGKVLINSSNASKYSQYPEVITIDATTLSQEILGSPITNTAMLGALLGASNLCRLASLEQILPDYLSEKVVARNIAIINRSYNKIKEDKA